MNTLALSRTRTTAAQSRGEDLLARIDAYAAKLKAATPWADVTRADAVRALLARGLEAAEGDTRKGPKDG